MIEEDLETIKALREKSYAFRHLEQSHHQLDLTLQNLNRRKVLSPEEEYKKKNYQKEKLAAKDTMMKMLKYYRKTGKADFNTG